MTAYLVLLPARINLGAVETGPGLGRSDANLLDAAYAALPPGGRLVVNAVTLEAAVELARRFKAQGGDLVRIEIARANPLGTF